MLKHGYEPEVWDGMMDQALANLEDCKSFDDEMPLVTLYENFCPP